MDNSKNHELLMSAYDEYSDMLYRHAFYRVSGHEEALDLVQDTFVKTWEYMGQGNDLDNIKAFLYSVLNNKIIDYYRKKKSSSLDELHEAGFNPQSDGGHEAIVESAEIKQIVGLLDKLQDNYRDVIIMRYVDGLSPQEIAKVTGEKENTVSVRLNRAVNKMKEILEL